MISDNIKAEFMTYLHQYQDDYAKVFSEQTGITDKEEISEQKAYADMMYEDLSDKGFDPIEIFCIFAHNPREKTLYKFLAYTIGLEDEFNDVEELKALLEDSAYGHIENYEQNDLEAIVTELDHLQ